MLVNFVQFSDPKYQNPTILYSAQLVDKEKCKHRALTSVD